MDVYSSYSRDDLIFQVCELLKELTNWGRYDNGESWDKKVAAFDLLVKEIPTKYLEKCALHAAQGHNRSKEFASFQVVSSWNELKEVIARDEAGGHAKRQGILACDCHGTGFVYLKEVVDGREIKGVRRCKSKCKSTSDLTAKGEPMPEEIKQRLGLVVEAKRMPEASVEFSDLPKFFRY